MKTIPALGVLGPRGLGACRYALLATLLGTSLPLVAAGEGVCTQTTGLAYEACTTDAQADLLTSRAQCLNRTVGATVKTCMRRAERAIRDANETCNEQRKARGEAELTTPDFMKRVKAAAGELQINPDMLRRPLNVGFSGGEKKRAEILQMALL